MKKGVFIALIYVSFCYPNEVLQPRFLWKESNTDLITEVLRLVNTALEMKIHSEFFAKSLKQVQSKLKELSIEAEAKTVLQENIAMLLEVLAEIAQRQESQTLQLNAILKNYSKV